MNDSTDKPEVRALDFNTQHDQKTLDSEDDAALDMKALEAISAGNSSTSDELALYGIKKVEGEMRQAARDAYRKEHPYAHPDDVENAIKDSFANIGLQGKSGA